MKQDNIAVASYLAHFNKVISRKIEEYATETVFLESRYLFTEREGKYQYGYCTYCNRHYQTNYLNHRLPNSSKNGVSHNSITTCPVCGSRVIVKSTGMHRKNLFDEAYFIYFTKSVIDPDTIVAYGIHAYRDYSRDYYEVETMHRLNALYVFQKGKSVMLYDSGYYKEPHWEIRSSVYSLFGKGHFAKDNIKTVCSTESIEDAIKDTCFRYSTWENYVKDDESKDMVTFFDLYSKYPSIEYLTKLGFGNLVETKLEHGNTYSAINWRGKNLFMVLRLNKQELKEIKTEGMKIDFLFLKLLQISRKDKSNLSLHEIYELSHTYDNHYGELESVLKFVTLRQVNNYLLKQKQIIKGGYIFTHLITWRDYLNDCIELGRDMTDDAIIFPKNIQTAHQNSMIQRKVKDNEKFDHDIIKFAKFLSKNRCFEYKGLLIRPAANVEEVITEGNVLHHCVGGYVERYSKRETEIHVLRKVSKPEIPYFTVEIRNDRIVQYQGKHNREKSAEVDEFIEVYKAEKLTDNQQKNRIQITVPA